MADLAQRIDSYFIEMEWPFDRVDEHLWRTAYPGDLQIHEVFISTDEPEWISFRSPVTKAPKPACAPALYEHLLRLNALIPMTKFCVMENHDIFAMIDLPTADLDFSEFRTALQNMVNHVDAYDNEILKVCEDEAHQSSLIAK
ncbi:hypothetical protein D3C72_911800 [compost metagenome]